MSDETINEELYRNLPNCWALMTTGMNSSNCFRKPGADSGSDPGKEYGYTGSIDKRKFRDAGTFASRLAPPSRRLMVLPESWGKMAYETACDGTKGIVLLHPDAGGTASAVFMGLSHVISRDPEATVVINILEHSIPTDESGFRAAAFAAAVIDRLPQKAILLGGDSGTELPALLQILPGQRYRKSLSSQLWTVRRLSNGSGFPKGQNSEFRNYLDFRSVVVAKVKFIWKQQEILQALQTPGNRY